MLRRIGLAAAAFAVLLLAIAPAASAHTEVTLTIPADGAVLELSPRLVGVVFNDAIRQDRTSIVVLDTAGTTIAEGGVDGNDPTRLVAELPPLADGTYIVRWTAYSADNELLRDQFTFEVAAAATPAPSEAPSSSPTVAPSPSPSAAAPTAEPATPAPTPAPSSTPVPGGGGDAQADPVQVLIPLVVGGAIVAAIAAWLIRRRRA